MDKPFNGAISRFYEKGAPKEVRAAIAGADKDAIITPDYPYRERLDKQAYKADLERLQVELVKLLYWVRETGARIVIVFEGRDAAGKGGTIQRFRANLNPRSARVVALTKPTDAERAQWYFQRYIDELPTGGEIVFYDRSWYNRGVVEKVFDFCTEIERERFFRQVLPFETALVDDGVHLFKFWLNVGRAEQLRRMLAREDDPLKQWKLSPIDVKGLGLWDDYTQAIGETLIRSHSELTPWTVLLSDDKRRLRVEAIRHVLASLDYARKDADAVGQVDGAICGGPAIWTHA